MKKRKCLECGYELNGRSDKKFCSDQCRNTHNNRQKQDSNRYVRNISHVIRKNRRILESIAPSGKSKVHRNRLLAEGFNFTFITNMYTTTSGKTYYFCYEYGYLPLEEDIFIVVRKDINVDD